MAPTAPSTVLPPRRPTSLATKVPIGMLIAALLISATSVVRSPLLKSDPVTEAIRVPYVDVGIQPVTDSIAFWRVRVDADPRDYISKTNLGTSLLTRARETGDKALYPEAEALLRDALTRNPTYEPALLGLGSARAASHDFAAQVALAGQVLARNPTSRVAKAAIADANFELGNYELAKRQLAELALLASDSVAIDSRLAKQSGAEGRHEDAIAYAARAVRGTSEFDYRPTDAAFYRFQLAYFLYQAGEVAMADDALDAGLAIDPQHLASLELKAKVLVARGHLGEAATSYEQLLRRGPAADVHGELAKVYRALGRDGEAAQQVQLGLQLGRATLGAFPAERRHLAGFFAELDPALALEAAVTDFGTRKDVGAYDTLAWAYYVNGRYNEAARYLPGALAQGSDEATLLYHAGMIQKAVGEADQARRSLDRALRLNPNFDLTQAPLAKAALAELGSPGR